MNTTLEKYKKINSNKTKKLIFNLSNKGFASEINNMILAILYCLVNDIEFCLYSNSWNGKFNRGWQDYFNPFCDEYNKFVYYRGPINDGRIKRHIKGILYLLQKLMLPKHLFINDVWSLFHNEKFVSNKFVIPELGINGDILHAKHKILTMIYCYNKAVQTDINEKGSILNNIKPYIGVHIRRGDKLLVEAKQIKIEKYVRFIKKMNTDIKNIFIATDDFQTIEEFQHYSPSNWNITHFCSSNNLGHYQKNFNANLPNDVRKAMMDIFIDIHFLSNANLFLGTFSSNIGRLVALFKKGADCYSMDCDWYGL